VKNKVSRFYGPRSVDRPSVH